MLMAACPQLPLYMPMLRDTNDPPPTTTVPSMVSMFQPVFAVALVVCRKLSAGVPGRLDCAKAGRVRQPRTKPTVTSARSRVFGVLFFTVVPFKVPSDSSFLHGVRKGEPDRKSAVRWNSGAASRREAVARGRDVSCEGSP